MLPFRVQITFLHPIVLSEIFKTMIAESVEKVEDLGYQ